MTCLQTIGTVLTIPTVVVIFLNVCCGAVFHCVKLPFPPQHGRVKYVEGTLVARLKCPKSNQDLLLTAPGEGGVMTCDPRKGEPFDFVNVKTQTCRAYRHPASLQMSSVFAFTSNSCDESAKNQLAQGVYLKLKELIPADFLNRSRVQWQQPEVDCDVNYSFNKSGKSKQVDVSVDLSTTTYNQAISVEQYLDDLDLIQLKIRDGFAQYRAQGVTYEKVHMTSWMADCKNHPYTVGTDLKVNRVAACRGCPLHHMADENIKKCWPCPKGTGTVSGKPNICSPLQ